MKSNMRETLLECGLKTKKANLGSPSLWLVGADGLEPPTYAL
jgi:hypothetical protein